MNKKQLAQIIYDSEKKGISYRRLAKKYEINPSRMYRILKSNQKKQAEANKVEPVPPDDTLPDDVDVLKEEIRKLRLRVELQDLIIDISSRELGVDLRKKPGTRQS